MALAEGANKIQYTVVSATTEFNFPYKYWDSSDLVVTVLDNTGAITTLVLGVGFTIAPTNGDPALGALVTTTATYSDDTITIERIIPVQSQSDFIRGASIPPDALNSGFDKATAQIQQLDDLITRQLQHPSSDPDGINYEVPSVTARANKVLGYDANGNVTTVVPLGDIGAVDTDNIVDGAVTLPKLSPDLQAKVGYDTNIEEFGVTGSGDTEEITAAFDSGKNLFVNFDLIISVPTNVATLQEAIERTMPGRNDITLTINIESAHSPSTGILLTRGHYLQHKITSTDATVTLSPTFPQTADFIHVTEGTAPNLSCLIDANGRALSGYKIERNCTGYVDENCGVINTKGDAETGGLCVFYTSRCYAKGSVFTGNYRNLWVSHESQCYADFSTLSGGVGDTNAYVGRSSIGGLSYTDLTGGVGSGVRARRSIITCLAADASNNGTDGILAQEGSIMVCNDQAVDSFLAVDCGQNAVSCDKSYVDFDGGTATGAGNKAINCTGGGTVKADNSILSTTAKPSTIGISCTSGTVTAKGTSIQSAVGNSVEAFSGGIVNIDGASLLLSGSRAIDASMGGSVFADDVTITTTVSDAVRLQNGSKVTLQDAVLTGVGARGIDAYDNSDISANGISITGSTLDGVRLSNISQGSFSTGTISGSGGTDVVVLKGGNAEISGVTTTAGSPAVADTNVVSFNSATSDGTVWA